MTKRPSFQWYPGDFKRDTALQACSFEARALWREMLDLMHDGEPYGHLTAGGVPIQDQQLARMIGVPLKKCTAWLFELESRSVFSRTREGVIFSRRMVRDEGVRNARAAGGPESTRPTGKRQGAIGQLFNFLVERYGGCLWCQKQDALELHRLIPGRRGGKYEPGNVLLLCRDDHVAMEYGELALAAVLAKANAPNPLALFEGFQHDGFKGIESIPLETPPAFAVAVAPSTTTTPPERERRTKAPATPQYTVEFEAFWATYPKRPGNSKAEAWRQWRARLAEGVEDTAMLAGGERYAAWCVAEQQEPKFIKHAATFLGRDRHFEADWTPSKRLDPLAARVSQMVEEEDVALARTRHLLATRGVQ